MSASWLIYLSDERQENGNRMRHSRGMRIAQSESEFVQSPYYICACSWRWAGGFVKWTPVVGGGFWFPTQYPSLSPFLSSHQSPAGRYLEDQVIPDFSHLLVSTWSCALVWPLLPRHSQHSCLLSYYVYKASPEMLGAKQ